MSLSEYQKSKMLWQEIRYWTRIKEVPIEKYDGLSDYLKNILHKIICKPQQIVSESQRNELFKALLSGSINGRDASYVDLTEIRDELLKPVTEEEIKDHLSKF